MTFTARRTYRITFEGRVYTRQGLARHLAGITGRQWQTCQYWLQRFDDDPHRVIAHARGVNTDIRGTSSGSGRKIKSRHKSLAWQLAGITGHPWYLCDYWLRRFDGDPARVIAHAATAPTHPEIAPVDNASNRS